MSVHVLDVERQDADAAFAPPLPSGAVIRQVQSDDAVYDEREAPDLKAYKLETDQFGMVPANVAA